MHHRTLASLLAITLGLSVHQAAAADKTLRVAPITDVQLLDPLFGSAWVNVVAGEMLYETLFAWDGKLEPRPQMVERWSTSDDGLRWSFTMRDGLRFHDGQPVTTADVIPSMRRWLAIGGTPLADATDALTATDDKSFVWTLKRPFPMMLDALAAVPSRMPAIMRAKDLAQPDKPVSSGIGLARSAGTRRCALPARARCSTATPITSRAASPPTGWPAAVSSTWIGWSGT